MGIIFCSFSEEAQEHPELVRKYLGSVVPYTDNFFATLNSAVFTDGSFCYIPKGVRCPMELSSYFRIYAERKGMTSTVEGRIRNRYADRLVSPEEIHADPTRFILCLSFFDIKHLIDIDPLPGGLYIYSSSEAYEEEQVIDQRRLHNWLERFGFEHVGFERSEGLHASGHASCVDLLGIVRGIAPHTLVPIHSKTPELYAEHLAGTGIQVIVPQAGVPIPI